MTAGKVIFIFPWCQCLTGLPLFLSRVRKIEHRKRRKNSRSVLGGVSQLETTSHLHQTQLSPFVLFDLWHHVYYSHVLDGDRFSSYGRTGERREKWYDLESHDLVALSTCSNTLFEYPNWSFVFLTDERTSRSPLFANLPTRKSVTVILSYHSSTYSFSHHRVPSTRLCLWDWYARLFPCIFCHLVYWSKQECQCGQEMVSERQRVTKGWYVHIADPMVCRTGAHLDYLKSQFAHIGDGKGNTLVKDGPSDYVLYTSGRRNMQYAHWWISVSRTRIFGLWPASPMLCLWMQCWHLACSHIALS